MQSPRLRDAKNVNKLQYDIYLHNYKSLFWQKYDIRPQRTERTAQLMKLQVIQQDTQQNNTIWESIKLEQSYEAQNR